MHKTVKLKLGTLKILSAMQWEERYASRQLALCCTYYIHLCGSQVYS